MLYQEDYIFSGILDSNGADASQIAAALKKSARKKRGGIIGGSLPSVGLDQDETQEIILKEEETSASTISTPGYVHSFLMSGSCHFNRASNDEFSVECLFCFFQPTWKSDLKVVQITKNDIFWVNAPL